MVPTPTVERLDENALLFERLDCGRSGQCLLASRADHSATLLPSGNVLLSGGYSDGALAGSTEVYDGRQSNFFAGNESLEPPSAGHAAALAGASVAVAGGQGSGLTALSRVQFFPFDDTRLDGTQMATERRNFALVALPDGTLVAIGGFDKDLRPLEYVVGDAVGRLGAPLYPMLAMEDNLQGYTTPDGVVLSGTMFSGAPPDNGQSGFEWGGEWTVTYETFRDMGLAFGVALVLIYMLVVGEFGNFVTPAVIMAPIPLTLLGIVPGHWIMGADFTATSMIGFIALAGIIVRNSILLVDFSIEEVARGLTVTEAVISACKARTRPIVITALALVAGSSVILTDPIFQGMAISLLFGVLISTLLTLVVIPLGCVSAGRHLVRR